MTKKEANFTVNFVSATKNEKNQKIKLSLMTLSSFATLKMMINELMIGAIIWNSKDGIY